MTGVILRCPNCGTSKATPGECEACHEAQVRYYCTNHTPGRWLDVAACPECGAKFGDPIRPSAKPIPPTAPARPRATAASPTPTRADPPPSPPRIKVAPWTRRDRERSPAPDLGGGDERAPVRDVRAERMLEILRAASRATRMGRRPTYTTAERPPVGASLGGCLMRFVILAMFLLIIIPLMLTLLGGSLFQMFGSYYF